MYHQRASINQDLTKERLELLQRLEAWLETPMLALAFVWLVLIAVELVWGLHPLLDTVGIVIWAISLLEFALRFILAPGNWDTPDRGPLPAR